MDDPSPRLELQWDRPQSIQRVVLSFDSDFDHPMESVYWDHPENVVPFCVKRFRLWANGRVIAECEDNHQTIRRIELAAPVRTDRLEVELPETRGPVPAGLFGVRCHGARAGTYPLPG
jgi:hypothetical protein